MWFHSPFRADEWMLFDIRSPRMRDGRGFAIGSLYQDGRLCVTCAQEGLLRLARPSTTVDSIPKRGSRVSTSQRHDPKAAFAATI